MNRSLRKFILPFALLIAALCYDSLSLKPKSTAERYESTKSVILNILESNAKSILDPQFNKLLSKPQLELEELNTLKSLTNRLAQQHIQVQLFDKDKLIFWTEDFDKRNFCKKLIHQSLNGTICYAPFTVKGTVEAATLEKHHFKNYFKKDHNNGPHKISNVPITLGKTFRTSTVDQLLLLAYFLAFLMTVILSTKHGQLWPLLLLLVSRIIAIKNEWTGRFSNHELVQSFSDNIDYNSIDLLLDSLLLFGGILFITKKFVNSFQSKMTTWEMAGLSFLHILIFISHIRLIQLLVSSENTSLSIEDLGSTSLSDLILFFSVVLLQLGIFHFGCALFKNYKTGSSSKSELYTTYGISITVAVIMSFFLKLGLEPGLLVLFLFCYILLMDLFVDVKTVSITWVIWWGIFYAIYLSALFFNYDIKKEIKSRQAFLKEVYHNIPSSKIKKIKRKGLVDTIGNMVNNLLILPDGINYHKRDLESFIAKKLGREDVVLELFDKKGKSLFDDSNTETNIFGALLTIDSLFCFDEIYNTIWSKFPIDDSKKLYIGFTDARSLQDFPFEFNYTRNKKNIIRLQNLSKSELTLLAKSDEEVIYEGSDVYTVYRPSSGRLLVSKKSFLGLIKPIALFSFLFSIIILMIMCIGFFHIVFRFLPKDWPLFVQDLESLNSKIQISLILVILLSFIVIASITSTFLKDYLAKEKDLVTRDKLENLAQEFETRAKFSNSSAETVEVIANYKKNIEDIHNVDLEVYPIHSAKNKLDYFTQMFFLKQSDPFAFSKSEDPADKRSFIPIYSGSHIAGIASLEMRSNIQSSQLNVFDFLGSIFNVYVFLFLIASVISIFIAQSITRPLSMLNQNLTKVKLGKNNEKLTWKRDDEIGILIGNYNTMVTKLEESAEILAKNERDSAWREMAKQVAHEIKNPLTPMKLSIQYLEKAIKQQPENADKIARKISTTMLEQIDNLTGIAEAFGNFAELPQTSNVKVELNNIVEVVHNLFRKREDMDIKLAVPIDPIYVYADKSQLVRILNNLVKNATEAIPTDKRGIIELSLYTKKDKAIIKVTDNGEGIPDSMKSKIFQPKFTTKDSGSGLGLAISANMIESMNGKIYFESNPPFSTSFFIELDIIRQSVLIDNKERIILD